jgi:hypothetical protein
MSGTISAPTAPSAAAATATTSALGHLLYGAPLITAGPPPRVTRAVAAQSGAAPPTQRIKRASGRGKTPCRAPATPATPARRRRQAHNNNYGPRLPAYNPRKAHHARVEKRIRANAAAGTTDDQIKASVAEAMRNTRRTKWGSIHRVYHSD